MQATTRHIKELLETNQFTQAKAVVEEAMAQARQKETDKDIITLLCLQGQVFMKLKQWDLARRALEDADTLARQQVSFAELRPSILEHLVTVLKKMPPEVQVTTQLLAITRILRNNVARRVLYTRFPGGGRLIGPELT